MLHFAQLPDELLTQVFSFLPMSDVWSTRLVCQAFSELAAPFLYQDIGLDLKPPFKPDCAYKPFQHGNLRLFSHLVDTFERLPSFGAAVESLALDVWHHPYNQGFNSHMALLRLVPNVRSLALKPPPVGLNLTSINFTRLDHLAFDFYNSGYMYEDSVPREERESPWDLVARQLIASTEGHPMGTNPETAAVTIPSPRPTVPRSSTVANPPPQFPIANALRSLTIKGLEFSETSEGKAFKFIPTRSLPVTSFGLLNASDHSIGFLPELLNCFKSLKRFTLETDIVWEGEHMFTHGLQPAALAAALQPHASTLEELIITGSDAAEYERDTIFTGLPSDYPKLKKLAIPDHCLGDLQDPELYRKVLPETLEALQIQCTQGFPDSLRKDRAWDARVKRMDDLAGSISKGSFEKLSWIVWWNSGPECTCGPIPSYGNISDLRRLEDRFEELGVVFEYLAESYYHYTPFDRGFPVPRSYHVRR